jgi:polyphosphate kinase 2 (PPK2 family)
VVPIGPPAADDQGRHWLYRFWRELPLPGTITVFDRSWYGRVLVERVDGLATKAAWKRAYGEINELERMLVEDGIDVVKIFLGVSKKEQLRRFEERLRDPYKHWKIGESDVQARKQWDDYIEAADDACAHRRAQRAGIVAASGSGMRGWRSCASSRPAGASRAWMGATAATWRAARAPGLR